MSFSVTKLAPAMVGPCEPTPSSTHLPLSPIDRAPGMRHLIDLFLVFGRGQHPAKVVREAFSRALVSYYPVAGRFVLSENGELNVACTGDGVWFVEASANCSLQDVNNLERPFMIPKEELIPCPPPQVKQEDVFLKLQVTEFTCGGYVVGIRFNHAIFDGVGVAQLLKAIAELAKGLAEPTVEPIWCREAIPDVRPSPSWANFEDWNPVFPVPSLPRFSVIPVMPVAGPGHRSPPLVPPWDWGAVAGALAAGMRDGGSL